MAPAGAVAHWLLTTQLRLSRLRGLPGMFNSFEVLECASCQLGFFSVIVRGLLTLFEEGLCRAVTGFCSVVDDGFS